MKAEQFRVGNYIKFLGDVKLIEGVSKRIRPDCGYFHIEGIGRPQKGIHVNSITLTEDWLKKFGFVDNDWGWYDLGDYSINLNKGKSVITHNKGSISEYYSDIPTCEYVHQLQNLYFALTGEELTYK